MRSRWHHVPQFHIPIPHHEKKVTWLELFYDLIFVAGFIQLGNALSEKVSFGVFLGFCGVFTPMWIAWNGFTYYANRFEVDDFPHRLIVFLKMLSVGAMAVTAPAIIKGEWTDPYGHRGFAVAYALSQIAVALLYLRSYRQQETGRAMSRYWGTVFASGALIWLASTLVPIPYAFYLWAVGLAIIFVAPVHKQSRLLREAYPHDMEHLSERFGLLTLIVLGESFVKVLAELVDKGASWSTVMQAGGALLITCSVWWTYFDDVAGSKLKKEHLTMPIWLYAHLPLQIGVTAVGVAIKKTIAYDFSVYDQYRWLLCGSLALTFLAAALIDSVSERKHAELSDRLRVNVRIASGVLMLLLPVVGQGMTGTWFIALVIALCALQVVIDMLVAPLEAREMAGTQTVAEIARRRRDGAEEEKRPRQDLSEAVRKGIPSDMRKDVYFYLMEGPWSRVFVGFFLVYLLVNLIFAALYMLEPGTIAENRDLSFADAFFFSVQTMSTIGYGRMAPGSDYGNMIVTIEAAVGLLGIAIMTGLMFAKFSRPRSSVLFTNRAVISTVEERTTLMFRMGNARGNDVVDARLNCSALIDEITTEGQHFRRIHDLVLHRDKTPFFNLTWTLFHTIDEKSPLRDIEFSQPNNLLAILITVTGHDGTYGQTVYARKTYYPEDIVCDHHFADVLSELPDGRLMVDYERFHDLEPDEAPENLE